MTAGQDGHPSRVLGPLSALRADAFLEGDAGFLAGLDESHLNRLACPILILVDDANELAVIIETAPTQSGVEHQRSDRHLPSIAFGQGPVGKEIGNDLIVDEAEEVLMLGELSADLDRSSKAEVAVVIIFNPEGVVLYREADTSQYPRSASEGSRSSSKVGCRACTSVIWSITSCSTPSSTGGSDGFLGTF